MSLTTSTSPPLPVLVALNAIVVTPCCTIVSVGGLSSTIKSKLIVLAVNCNPVSAFRLMYNLFCMSLTPMLTAAPPVLPPTSLSVIVTLSDSVYPLPPTVTSKLVTVPVAPTIIFAFAPLPVPPCIVTFSYVPGVV